MIKSGDFVVGVVYRSTVLSVVLIVLWIALVDLTTAWRVIVKVELTTLVMWPFHPGFVTTSGEPPMLRRY